jgi:thioredoxin-like negative regulator of GroEL
LEHQFLEIWPGLPDEILSNKKNPIWVDFWGPWYGTCWIILCPLGMY